MEAGDSVAHQGRGTEPGEGWAGLLPSRWLAASSRRNAEQPIGEKKGRAIAPSPGSVL